MFAVRYEIEVARAEWQRTLAGPAWAGAHHRAGPAAQHRPMDMAAEHDLHVAESPKDCREARGLDAAVDVQVGNSGHREPAFPQ
jgi:hypothetical protein